MSGKRILVAPAIAAARAVGGIGLTAALLALAGCGEDGRSVDPPAAADSPAAVAGDAAYSPRIEPASFSTTIDNPLFPLPVGRTWEYEAKTDEGIEKIKVVVTPETAVVDGITCVVVRDTARVNGTIIEDTVDWYAQDADGNVWYFGEQTSEYVAGKAPDTHGTWTAGVDRAQPGIVMKAHPALGDAYRQEYYAGEAEDEAEILRTGDSAEVPFGSYRDVLVTKDFTALDPGKAERKYYAPGVGVVKSVALADGQEEVLVRMTG